MRQQIIPSILNRPQSLGLINYSRINTHIWSRGTGKTTFLGIVMGEIAHALPRSANALVCRTYLQALTRTMPAMAASLESIGYYEGIHWVRGIKPPDSWPKPYFPPMDYQNFISWYTGAGWHIVSQDRKGSSRGFNIDSWMADEGLNLKKDMIDDEITVANRANQGKFGNNKYHLSEMVVSSQPILPESKWLLKRADYYQDFGQNYEDYRNRLSQLLLAIVDAESESEMDSLWMEALEIKREFKFFRNTTNIPVTGHKLTNFFLDADIFDNIKNLKWPYIKHVRSSMSDIMFTTEVLNGIFTTSEKGFYPDLSDRHVYDTEDYSRYDDLILNINAIENAGSTYDSSVNAQMPLHIACDYGGSFNCMVVSQQLDDEERFVQSFYEYHPKKITDVVAKFNKYFDSHPTKKVHFWYDQTAIGTSGLVEFNYADEVVRVLKSAGWDVVEHYMGSAPGHDKKFLLINKILSEAELNVYPKIRMHREFCRDMYISLKLAGIQNTSRGFGKDKRPEQKKSVDQKTATHLSDAFDLLIYHKYSSIESDAASGFSVATM